MLGSISIAVNSLTGPAMLDLPATFARSGVIPTIATLILVCILAALCSLHMANTISKVPGNADFQRQVEYSQAFEYYFRSRQWFAATQLLFFGCIACLNISSMVDTSQVVDTFLGHWMPHGGTAAVRVLLLATDDNNKASWWWVRWDYSVCSDTDLRLGQCLPFQDQEKNGILLTAGNLVTTVVFLPLALVDLKENAAWQILGFLILLVTSAQFIVQFAMGLYNNTDDNTTTTTTTISWWGHEWGDLFGVVLFNFCVVIAVPAWLYEREPHVHVPTVINYSSLLSTILYIAIGVLGCLAMPNVSDNMLESMMSGALGSFMQLGATLFAFAIIGLGIPLFSVLTRLNLHGICSRNVANVLAVYFPFAVSWLLTSSGGVTKLLSWGGTIFTSLVAFILPLVLTIHVVEQNDVEGSIDVYYGWFQSRASQLRSLRILLVVATLAIAVAIGGNLLNSPS